MIHCCHWSEERLQEPKLASGDEWRRLLAAKDVDTQVLIDACREGVKVQLVGRKTSNIFKDCTKMINQYQRRTTNMSAGYYVS